MPHGPRRFAKNSENVRHFRLVSRSGRDTEVDQDEASPLVLEPFVPTKVANKLHQDEAAYAELMSIPESLQGAGSEVFGLQTRGGVPEDRSKDLVDSDDEERDEFAELDNDCYFPKDGYNYNQHLKTLSTSKKKGGHGGVVIEAPTKSPSWVGEAIVPISEEEIKIQPALSKDAIEVMKALEATAFEAEGDEAYEECDDELDGLLSGALLDPEVTLWGPTALEYQDRPDLALFKEMHAAKLAAMAGEEEYDDDEPFIEEGLPAAGGVVSDARFEQLLDDEYAEEEDGALDDDEIEGNMNLENMEDMLDEYLEDRQAETHMLESLFEPQEGKLDDEQNPRVINETKAIIERHYTNEEDDADTSEGESEEDESKNWDCETVLSTLSNVSNRPGKIGKIKVLKKPAPTKDLPAIGEGGEEADDEEDSESDAVELPDVVTERPKGESSEDKRIRKAAVKEMRRICRRMKKESKDMYKAEAAKIAQKKGGSDVREKARIVKL